MKNSSGLRQLAQREAAAKPKAMGGKWKTIAKNCLPS
jgi:hypothetical protein